MPIYWIWFAQLKGISLRTKRQLLENFLDPEELFRAEEKALTVFPKEVTEALQNKDLAESTGIYRQCLQKGIGILTFADAAYPESLRNIEDPPMVLYFKGSLPDWHAQPVIGVVGTRKASPYGLQTAHLLSSQIAACGGLVVSGVAAGVDAWSMEGALDAGKPAVGVLGCGIDVVYPASNRALYKRTEEIGCLISEYSPGTRPFPGNFLHRNRIISGVSAGLLVVEAPEKSGALNTARHAFTQGRDLFVAPGNLGVQTCLGSNALLQEGAYAALSGWDVVKHYAHLYPGVVEKRSVSLHKTMQPPLPKVAEVPVRPENAEDKKKSLLQNAIDNLDKSTYSVINKRPADLSDRENAVLALLSDVPQLPDSVMDASDLAYSMVQSILTKLTIKGLVIQHPDGRISRK